LVRGENAPRIAKGEASTDPSMIVSVRFSPITGQSPFTLDPFPTPRSLLCPVQNLSLRALEKRGLWHNDLEVTN
jgi:hypothetical protein